MRIRYSRRYLSRYLIALSYDVCGIVSDHMPINLSTVSSVSSLDTHDRQDARTSRQCFSAAEMSSNILLSLHCAPLTVLICHIFLGYVRFYRYGDPHCNVPPCSPLTSRPPVLTWVILRAVTLSLANSFVFPTLLHASHDHRSVYIHTPARSHSSPSFIISSVVVNSISTNLRDLYHLMTEVAVRLPPP